MTHAQPRHRASPEDVEEAIVHYEDGVPSLREIAGSRGAFLLVDRSAGKAIGVTLWESEESMGARMNSGSNRLTELGNEVRI